MNIFSPSICRTLMLTLVSLIAVATQHSQVPAAIHKDATATPPLELKLTAFTSALCLDASFEVQLEVVNTSHKDVVISKYKLEQGLARPSVTKASQDNCDSEMFIESSCGRWDPEEDELLTLVPGQSYQAVRNFEAKSLFDCNSSYDVTFNYEVGDRAERVAAALYGGRVTSNKLRIETFTCN